MSVLEIGGVDIAPGEEKIINLEVTRLYDHTEMHIPIKVIRGKEEGPRLFLSAAIHGDELNGVEIIRRVLHHKALKDLRGTLIAVPIVNIFGFIHLSRYLPDRRDLNRSFPGSKNGSLAARLAAIFMEEIVKKSTHGIDFHSGSYHRCNLPQIRAFLGDKETRKLAKTFGVSVILNSNLRDASLREATSDLKIPMLLFEGGEALRFDESVIRTGVQGTLSVMASIGMIDSSEVKKPQKRKNFIALSSHWIRSPHSGIHRALKKLGSAVTKDDVMGLISDPFGRKEIKVKARESGIIIGMSHLPLVNRGDAIYHVATFKDTASVVQGLNFSDGTFDAM